MATKLNKTLVGVLTVGAMLVMGVVGFLLIYNLPGADPTKFEADGKAAEDKGDWKVASENYYRAFRLDRRATPTQKADRLSKVARCLFELGEFQPLREFAKQARVFDSQHKPTQELLVKAEYELAKSFPSSPQWKVVLDDSDRLVKIDPQNALGQEAYGTALLALSGEDRSYRDRGEKALRESLKVNPSNTEALVQLAEFLHSENRSDEADQLLASAIDRSATSNEKEAQAKLLVYKGKRLLMKGDLDAASKEFKAAEELMPGLSDSHVALAAYWIFKGKDSLNDAIAELIKAKTIDPKASEVYLTLARVYQQQGKVDDQLKVFDEGLAAIPKGDGFRSIKSNYLRVLMMKEAMAQWLSRGETTTSPAESISKAEAWLKRATDEVGPDHPEVRLMRARLKRAQNKLVEATRETEQLDQSLGRSRNVEVKALLADLYAQQGQNGAAADALREAIAAAPFSSNLYLALAKILLRQGAYEQALRALQPEGFPGVRRELEGNREAALIRSDCFRALNRPEDIERERKLIEEGGGSPIDRLRSAQLLAAQERMDDAAAAVRAIIKDDPKNIQAYTLLAQILATKKPADEAGAREAVEAGLRAKPDDRSLKLLSLSLNPNEDPEVRKGKLLEFVNAETNPFFRAIMTYNYYMQNGGNDEKSLAAAKTALDEAEKLEPNSPMVLEQQFKFAVRRKDWAAAEKYVERDKELNADGTRGKIMRGRLAMARNEFSKAIQFYREGLAEYPSNSQAWTLLAGAYLINNQRAEARAALDQHALKLDPANGDANRMMAALLIEQGDRAAAKPYLTAAARALPNDTFVKEQAQLLAEQDDPVAGIASREKVRASDPTNIQNLITLAGLYAKTKKPDQADECLRAALAENDKRIGDGNREAYRTVYEAARIYGKQLDRPADGEKALSELLKKVEKKEDKAGIASMLAAYYDDLDLQENAERYYLLAATLSPTANVTAAAGEFYARINRASDALDWFQKARDLAKDDPAILPTIQQRIIQSVIMLRDKKRAATEIDAYIAAYPDDEQGPLFKGLFYLQQGDVGQAEKAFQQQLEKKPDSAVALWQYGQIQAMRQRWPIALDMLKKAKAFRPDAFNYEHRIALGKALIASGKFEEGIAELQSILKESPDAANAATALIEQYMRADPPRLGDAESLAYDYMRRFPDDYRWPQFIGQIGVASKDSRKAIAGFSQAVQASKFATSPVLQLIAAMEAAGRYDDVIAFVTKALPANRRRRLPMAEAALGKAYAAKKEPEEANKHFDAALTAARDDFEAYRFIAATMAVSLGVESALDQAQKRLAADKAAGRSTSESLKLMMQLLFQLQRYDEAVRVGDEIIDSADRDDDLLFGLLGQAITLTKMGKFQDAKEKYEKALALDPSSPLALNNAAYMLVDNLKQPAEALKYAERAEQIAPRDANTVDTLGWALAESGRLGDAEGTLLKAVDLDPGNIPALYHLGMVYQRMGNKEDARTRFEAAIRAAEKAKETEFMEKAEKALKELSSQK